MSTLKTAERLAEQFGVDEKTIRRDGKLAAEVEADPDLMAASRDSTRMDFTRIRKARRKAPPHAVSCRQCVVLKLSQKRAIPL